MYLSRGIAAAVSVLLDQNKIKRPDIISESIKEKTENVSQKKTKKGTFGIDLKTQII
jgi:hypothetical protein